jgi:YHS domain-containing protein
VALSGYDPVSYFTAGRPEKGSPQFIFVFDDASYWFRDAEHRALFAADPEKYAPQYDGYCAISLSGGKKLEPDPEAWAIAEGKLYVFGAKRAVAMFAQNQAGVVSQANANWQTLRKAH